VIQALLQELEERHGLVPADGLQLLSASALTRRPFDPGWPVVIVPEPVSEPVGADDQRGAGRSAYVPAEAAVLFGREARVEGPASLLRRLYPADHPVRGMAGASDTSVGSLTDAALAGGGWLVPPLEGQANAASPHGLPWLVARLRAPGGCPWDAEQTHQSLRKFVLEEAYEVYDALDAGSTPALAEELGDLLLQVVLHAHYAAEAGVFDLADVYRAVVTKIVRRHPHVFGDGHADSAEAVLRSWERIKADERAEALANGTAPARSREATREMPAAFAGLSRSLPALHYAQEMQERAASLGYDWPDVEGVIDKLEEEAVELLNARNEAERREEFGDLLLVIVNLGRKLGLDAEAALRQASAKFARRFRTVERLAAEDGTLISALGFDALDDLWERAKRSERVAEGDA
jgi:tetrapyrrole methylase family protein/MazG family protein